MPDKNQNQDDQLRLENELSKINLEINHGAKEFFVSDDLPPEMEKAFLENVARFEQEYAKGDTISVYEFIGSPDYVPVEKVEDAEKEIERILALLEEKGVTIDRPEHLAPIGYYRFLTHDLFQHQMMNVQIEGMIHGFIYSEFRHDGPEFVEEHVEDFLLRLLNLERPFEFEFLSETCRSQQEAMTKEEALACIQQFRAQYDELVPLAFQQLEMKYHEGFMYFVFGIAWEGKRNGETEEYEGTGICQLEFEGEEWMVQGVQMPGFEFEKA
jgi:siroheme synthase (precorrin-2 oxidase/ferrochelatase)